MKSCPTCHRPFGGKHRTCFACELPILRGHKWHTVGCYNVHDNCANPTMRTLFKAELAGEPAAAQVPAGNLAPGPALLPEPPATPEFIPPVRAVPQEVA